MPDDTPTEKVISLRDQGFTNDQIMQALQKDGYAADKIGDAMQQADIKKGITKADLERGGPMPNPEMQPGGVPPLVPQPEAPTVSVTEEEDTATQERIEEVAEAIIDERWDELTENIKLIVDWKNKVEARVAQIEANMNAMKDNFDKLHEAVIGKISEYDQNIRGVGTNIKALEQVFQKILPGFVDNVHELSRVTEKIKKIAGPEKKSASKK